MFILIILFLSLILIITIIRILNSYSMGNKRAFIVVLGDLGRSPRMNYHCLSLAKLDYKVSLIGYKESKQMEEIESNQNVSIVPLATFPKYLQVGPTLIQYIIKALFLTITLFLTLIRTRPVPKFVLVQNPPSIPTLAIVYIYCVITGSKFIIDWHNYGFTILALKNGSNNILVKICKKFEIFFGQRSHFNICVTQAMQKDLAKYNIKAVTSYDKAHERFHKLEINQKHDFFLKLIQNYKIDVLKEINSNQNTIFTQVNNNGSIEFKQKRPVLLVSSSSWTEDEDFHLLIKAFEIYQNRLNTESGAKLPDIICMLTGKGPLKQYYQNLFKGKNFKNIQVHFLWLEPEDYPKLLGSCDLGLCFHMSSSNLDLPMKVVDMFGVGLPALCLEFSCISELVKHNENGMLFSNEKQLSEHFFNLFADLNENKQLASFRQNIEKFSNWTTEWNEKIKPIIENIHD